MSRDGSTKLSKARRHMLTHDIRGRGIQNTAVLDAMAGVPREQFVTPRQQDQAYADRPLPIGADQTISQPYIVALMTEQLDVQKEHEVLEIGTGSGYQTAVLATLARRIYSIERLTELSLRAQGVLSKLGYHNIEYAIGDGSLGWHEAHVFDRIMVTAAVPQVPDGLWQQLREGGTLVAPLGTGSTQTLVRQEKGPGDLCREISICQVRFVKLRGLHGFP